MAQAPHRWLAASLALILGFPLMATAAPGGKPIAPHPENPRYFLFEGKPTFLITSGEHYGAVLNLDFDFVPYLDELHRRGFNLTRTFSGTYREVPGSFKIAGNTLAPAPGRYAAPWARSATPGAADGGNKFDLDELGRGLLPPAQDVLHRGRASAGSSSSSSCSAPSTTRGSGRRTR